MCPKATAAKANVHRVRDALCGIAPYLTMLGTVCSALEKLSERGIYRQVSACMFA